MHHGPTGEKQRADRTSGRLDERRASPLGSDTIYRDLPAHPVFAEPRRRRPQVLLTSLPLIAADAAALIGSMAIAMLISRLVRGIPVTDGVTIYAVLTLVPLQLIYFINGLYPGVALHAVLELRAIVKHNLAVLLAGLVVMYLMGHQNARPIAFILGLVFSLFAVPICRSMTRHVFGRYAWWGLDVVIVGTGEPLARVVHQLRRNHAAGLKPVAVVDLKREQHRTFAGVPVLPSVRVASRWARRSGTRYALLSMPTGSAIDIGSIVQRFSRSVPHVLIASGPAELPALWRDSRHCGSVSGTEIGNKLTQPLPCLFKRTMDLTLTLAGGLLLLPLFAFIIAAIKLSSPGPAFYGHTRIGLNGRRFKVWKFRSMVTNGDEVLQHLLATDPAARSEWARDHKLRNDPRITWIGKLLRKTSLDELPQLWNVITGEMSLVGPRPIVEDEVSKYGRIYRKYKSVKPGITGLWQTSGRNNTTYAERIEFDQYYVRNWSPWLDVYVIARTFQVVAQREGAH